MLYFPRSLKHRIRQLVVLTVVEAGPTILKLGVLLRIESATPAKNTAIMRSVVEALKGQSPGKGGTPRKGNRTQRRRNVKPPRTVNQVNEESKPRSSPSSSGDEYTFTVNSPTTVSAPFVSLKVNGVICKFLVDSGASVNIVSHNVSKMLNRRLELCDAEVYAFNSSKPLPVLGKFKALVESKCNSVDSEFLAVDVQDISSWIHNCYRSGDTANCKRGVCGKECVSKLPQSF